MQPDGGCRGKCSQVAMAGTTKPGGDDDNDDDGDDDNDGDERERECIFQVKAISIIVCYLYPTCGATWSILIFFL